MAWYAAIIGTIGALTGGLSLAWQVSRWKRERQTRIVVRISRVAVPYPGLGEILLTTAINESDYPVRVLSAHVEIDYAAGPGYGQSIDVPPPGASLPGVIEPYDQGETACQFRGPGGTYAFGLNDRIRGCVKTSAGVFCSDWELVRGMPLVREHGRDLPIPPSLAAGASA